VASGKEACFIFPGVQLDGVEPGRNLARTGVGQDEGTLSSIHRRISDIAHEPLLCICVTGNSDEVPDWVFVRYRESA
jgi:hypothetical protein